MAAVARWVWFAGVGECSDICGEMRLEEMCRDEEEDRDELCAVTS